MRYRPAFLLFWSAPRHERSWFKDILAGVTVGLVALPLAMAFGIASVPLDVARELAQRAPWLTPPAIGLFTAIVAGLLVSALGGSRVQIGGPTGAFIGIVYTIAARHGYDGLVVATWIAGLLLIGLGLCRFGAVIKFIPYPVIVGFTAGIAVIIATSQLPNLLGLRFVDANGRAEALPPEFIGKVVMLARHVHDTNLHSLALGLAVVLFILVLRRRAPRLPGPILAVVLATLVSTWLSLPVETIGARFGELPRSLPAPFWPQFDWTRLRELLPAAATIALLGAIESMLSAVVADGMTGQRHDPDSELVGQGIANLGSALFGGIPATGAIARTATNVRAGGRSPLAGITHAVTLVLFLVLAAPLAERVPLCALAGLLLVVAWNMAEVRHFVALLRAPRGDVAVLLTSFALTVLVDLTYGVGFGVVASSLLFMRRMAAVGAISDLPVNGQGAADANGLVGFDRDAPLALSPELVPPGVVVYQLQGPFFFGVADRLLETLQTISESPRAFVLRMRLVPTIDATGIHALELFVGRCQARGTKVLLTGVMPPVRRALDRAGVLARLGPQALHPDAQAALESLRAEWADAVEPGPTAG